MISVRLDSDTENQLQLIAKERHISKSQIIKDSLKHYFELLKNEQQEKSAYELGKDLFGKHSSNQGDLSSTYKQKLKKKISAKNNH